MSDTGNNGNPGALMTCHLPDGQALALAQTIIEDCAGTSNPTVLLLTATRLQRVFVDGAVAGMKEGKDTFDAAMDRHFPKVPA